MKPIAMMPKDEAGQPDVQLHVSMHDVTELVGDDTL